jgi:hypothetical protein
MPVALGTPQEATRSVLERLRAQLHAMAQHDRDAAARYRDEVVQEVAARDDILARYNALGVRAVRDDAEVLRRLVESWAAMLAYYADGLALEQMRLGAAGGEGSKAVVDVPAHGRDSETILQVYCVRGPDGQWRVGTLELAPPRPALPAQSAPVSQPVSASSPIPK